jgi:hypothetical protein
MYELHIVFNMNINSLVPNDAYAALQDVGFNSLITLHMCCPTVAILVKSSFFGGGWDGWVAVGGWVRMKSLSSVI